LSREFNAVWSRPPKKHGETGEEVHVVVVAFSTTTMGGITTPVAIVLDLTEQALRFVEFKFLKNVVNVDG
jgi:hypothetical protein